MSNNESNRSTTIGGACSESLKKRKIEFYNLDAIISVGFRVCGLRFRCQPEGCRQEALRLHPHARDLSLGTAE